MMAAIHHHHLLLLPSAAARRMPSAVAASSSLAAASSRLLNPPPLQQQRHQPQRRSPATASPPLAGGGVRAYRATAPAPSAAAVRRRRPRGSHPGGTGAAASAPDVDGGGGGAGMAAAPEDGGPPAHGLSPIPVTDPHVFRKEASALLDRLEAALRPLEPLNRPSFELVRGRGGREEGEGDVYGDEYLLLDLGPIHGQYELRVNAEELMVLLSSPISGQRFYVLSASSGTFCGLEDSHALEGLLVRDLIRQIYGVPQL